jgi:hypothetical protein
MAGGLGSQNPKNLPSIAAAEGREMTADEKEAHEQYLKEREEMLKKIKSKQKKDKTVLEDEEEEAESFLDFKMI